MLTISPEILNNPQARLPIRHRRVHVMLLPILIHREAFEVNVPAGSKLRLHGSRDVDRTLHTQLLHPTLHHRELDRNHASHLDRATEANFAIPLAKMKIADRELRAIDVHGQIHFAAEREILNIAVASMLGAAGDRACAFAADLLFDRVVAAADVDGLRVWWEGDHAGHVAACRDEFGFAFVPGFEDFGGGRAAQDAGMNEAGKADAGDMAGGAEYSLKVPDGFRSVMLSSC